MDSSATPKEVSKRDPNIILFAFSASYKPWNALSSFWQKGFIYKGVYYKSCEHAYQAGKTLNQKDFIAIRDANHAVDAKKLGSKLEHIRADWNTYKFRLMRELQMAKFTQSEEMRTLLLSSGTKTLIHAAPWDAVWGDGPDGKGENRLGKILMDIREVLQDQVDMRG